MTDVLKSYSTRATPQNKRARADQKRNNAGGYTFVLDDVARLRRFLILGSDSTYYASGTDLTRENAEVVVRMAENDHKTLVDTIVDVSVRGAAAKVNTTIFALALAASLGSDADKAYALSKLNEVVRTGTHLTLFVSYVEQFRGWGRGLRRAVGGWYTDKSADQVAYQITKYASRNGWTHRDILRKAHASTLDPALNAALRYAARGEVGEDTPQMIRAFLAARQPGADLPALVREHGLTWEMLPSEGLNDVAVWNALLDSGMGTTALIRQLPRLTRLGMFEGKNSRMKEVVAAITDHEALRKARVHPIALLNAERTYTTGRSLRGESVWTPKRQIIDALSDGFTASFENVEPSGARICHALDVSGSMTFDTIAGTAMTPRDASAALALTSLAVDGDNAEVVGFTSGSGSWSSSGSHRGWGGSGISELSISPRQRLSDAIASVSNLPFGSTDCALPMLWAQATKREFDAFVVYTDSETWAGNIQPHQALVQYRESTGIDAKLIVVGMTATEFTIADSNDKGMLDVVGFDTNVPKLISEFAGGRL